MILMLEFSVVSSAILSSVLDWSPILALAAMNTIVFSVYVIIREALTRRREKWLVQRAEAAFEEIDLQAARAFYLRDLL